MPEVTAQPELTQILTILQAMRQDIQTLDKKLDVYIATTDERLKSIEEKMDIKFQEVDRKFQTLEEKMELRFQSLEAKMDIKFKALDEKVDDLKQEVSDLRTQQRTTDNRILTFTFTALAAAIGLLTKVIFFSDKA